VAAPYRLAFEGLENLAGQATGSRTAIFESAYARVEAVPFAHGHPSGSYKLGYGRSGRVYNAANQTVPTWGQQKGNPAHSALRDFACKEDLMSVFSATRSHLAGHFLGRNLICFPLAFLLALLVAYPASAQYGGGSMGGTGTSSGSSSSVYTAPSGGYSSATGAAIGAGAAAGVVALFLALHYRGRVTGCVQEAGDGLRLVEPKKNESLTLFPGDVTVKPGERVLLKGKKSTTKSGARIFEAKKLVKVLGSCDTGPSASANHPGAP
jgi:hypothetical protein